MSDTLARRIEILLEREKRSARDVSMAVTGKPDTVRNILRGNTRDPKGVVLEGIARELRTNVDYLLYGSGPGLMPAQATDEAARQAMQIGLGDVRPANIVPPAFAELPRDVPVHGTAAGSHTRGAFQLFDGIVDYVRRPAGLATNRTAYALYVEGESMVPQFGPGELIFINPSKPTRFGDSVVIQMQTGPHEPVEATIGILRGRTSDHVVIGKHNPAANIEINRRYIIAIHRVTPNNELYGA